MIHNAQTVKTALYILLIYIYNIYILGSTYNTTRLYADIHTVIHVIYRYNADFICTKHTFYKRSTVNYG